MLPSGWPARRSVRASVPSVNIVVLGQQGGEIEKPSLPKCLEGLRNVSGNSSRSLAVFYVEQVALNRHVLPQLRLPPLCLKSKEMSRKKPES